MQIPKQDRQGVRTAAQLEKKYNFRKKFAELFGLVDGARKTADSATKAAETVQKKLTQEGIFNILTNNGKNQGIYRDERGEIYINGEYIKTDTLVADMLKGKMIKSAMSMAELNDYIAAELIDMPPKEPQEQNTSTKMFTCWCDFDIGGFHLGAAFITLHKAYDESGFAMTATLATDNASFVVGYGWLEDNDWSADDIHWTADIAAFGAIQSWDYDGCFYRVANARGDMEWINPPMLPGVAYRTVKRHRGNAVYTGSVEFEITSADEGYIDVATGLGITSDSEILYMSGAAQSGSGCYPVPYSMGAVEIRPILHPDDTMRIWHGSDFDGTKGIVVLEWV